MLDLDFAFFNLIDRTIRGLVSKKVILDRLAPLIFAPRLEKLINIPYLNSRGGNILLPLGWGNLDSLPLEKQILMAVKTENLLEEYRISSLAVDRRLQNLLPHIFPRRELIFGENFIPALARVLIKEHACRHELRRIIIIGNTGDFFNFIVSLEQYQLPISIQNFYPHQDEIFIRQLLYEKGQAVSISYLEPDNWEAGDLVMVFDDNFAPVHNGRAAFILLLNNNSYGLAPDLESELARQSLAPALFNLAPILESCLIKKTGLAVAQPADLPDAEPLFLQLEEAGREWGLWDHFLDKDW